MGFFKSLFSSPQISEEQQQEQVSVEKKRIAFETLRDGGVRAITLKEYKLAEDYFVKAIELNSDDEEIKALLAEAYLGENKMEDALKILKPMSEKHPDNPRIWISMAQAALQLENWEEVLKFCAEYERLDSVKASVYYYEGMAFYGLKDYDSAVMRFGKAIDLSDNFVMAYYMRSKAYFLQNKIEEAEKDVNYLIENDLGEDFVCIQKGKLREVHEDYKGALSAYGKALDANPFCVEAYVGKVKMYRFVYDDAQALKICEDAVENMQDSTELLRLLAELKENTGDEEGAKECLEKADSISSPERKENESEYTQIQNRIEDDMKKSNPFGL